jgi:hypothetical protein
VQLIARQAMASYAEADLIEAGLNEDAGRFAGDAMGFVEGASGLSSLATRGELDGFGERSTAKQGLLALGTRASSV